MSLSPANSTDYAKKSSFSIDSILSNSSGQDASSASLAVDLITSFYKSTIHPKSLLASSFSKSDIEKNDISKKLIDFYSLMSLNGQKIFSSHDISPNGSSTQGTFYSSNIFYFLIFTLNNYIKFKILKFCFKSFRILSFDRFNFSENVYCLEILHQKILRY